MNWKEAIESKYEGESSILNVLNGDELTPFTEIIWRVSQEAFESPKEVQVVIDDNDELFMSVGTASFVDFPHDMDGGMKLPIKCWIHTHPMGRAYWSGTDMGTLKSWFPLMKSAIVLGYREHQTWQKFDLQMKHVRYAHTKYLENPLHIEKTTNPKGSGNEVEKVIE
tara:strand:+ start:1500 stop:2000 length:501 start_codon:yes stop_codon:yes gene_type:complete